MRLFRNILTAGIQVSENGALTPGGTGGRSWIRTASICLLLAVAILIVFWPVRHFGFTHYDDDNYVTQNPMVPKGLTPQGIWWALTTGYFSYWHPLTWVSHMTDVELFGMRGGAHHMVSVALHFANSVLLFLALQWMTRSQVKSALVAALFALHPAHVESVAWIAERKDLLSGLFWILCIWAYAWYAENRALHRYLIALFFFACGLMSKPMVVTLPCVLFLLDWWPLGRFPWVRLPASEGAAAAPPYHGQGRAMVPVGLRQLIVEKLPFFGGSLLSAGVTYYGVHHAGSLVSEQVFPLGLRLANVPISYVRYLGKLFWPSHLTVFYPMPHEWPVWMVLGASALLVLLTVPIVLLVRRCPYLISGWLWYLGPLIPTIGIIPVGLQSIADRYTYLPFIGLFWMIVWGADDLARRLHLPSIRAGLALAACTLLVPLTIVSHKQTAVWKDTRTLFAHSIAVTRDNAVAHYNLGLALYLDGDRKEALHHFERAVAADANYADANNNVGMLLIECGEYAKATNYLRKAAALKPKLGTAHVNLARALIKLGDLQGARSEIEPLLKENPAWTEGLYWMGVILAKSGKLPEAQGHFEAALARDPQFEEAQIGLARVLIAKGKAQEGIAQLQEAMRANPQGPKILAELAWILATHPDAEIRNGTEAVSLAQRANELSHGKDARGLAALAAALVETGDFDNAIVTARNALDQPLADQATKSKLHMLLAQFENRKPHREMAVEFDDL